MKADIFTLQCVKENFILNEDGIYVAAFCNFRFGYVEFETEAAAEKICSMSKGGVEVEGVMLTVEFAKERSNDRGGTWIISF